MAEEETAVRRRRPRPRPRGYYWIEDPDGMLCVRNGKTQTVKPKLWEAEAATEAHSDVLMEATREINEVLEEVGKHPPEPDLELSLIVFQGQYMLAWTQPMRGLGPHDDPLEIARAFHLRRDDPDYPESDDEE